MLEGTHVCKQRSLLVNIQYFQLGLTFARLFLESKITRDFAAQCWMFTYTSISQISRLCNEFTSVWTCSRVIHISNSIFSSVLFTTR